MSAASGARGSSCVSGRVRNARYLVRSWDGSRDEAVDHRARIRRRVVPDLGRPRVGEGHVDGRQVDPEAVAVAGVRRIAGRVRRIADVHEDVSLDHDGGVSGERPTPAGVLGDGHDAEARGVELLDVVIAAGVLTEDIAEGVRVTTDAGVEALGGDVAGAHARLGLHGLSDHDWTGIRAAVRPALDDVRNLVAAVELAIRTGGGVDHPPDVVGAVTGRDRELSRGTVLVRGRAHTEWQPSAHGFTCEAWAIARAPSLQMSIPSSLLNAPFV